MSEKLPDDWLERGVKALNALGHGPQQESGRESARKLIELAFHEAEKHVPAKDGSCHKCGFCHCEVGHVLAMAREGVLAALGASATDSGIVAGQSDVALAHSAFLVSHGAPPNTVPPSSAGQLERDNEYDDAHGGIVAPGPVCNGPLGDEEDCPVHGEEIRRGRGRAGPASSESLRETLELIANGEWVTDSSAQELARQALASAPSPVQPAYRVGPCSCCESAGMWEVFCGDRPLRWSSSDKELVESVCELLTIERSGQAMKRIAKFRSGQ